MGCQSLLQGNFPTQGWNLGLPHCRWILYHLSHQVTSLQVSVLSFVEGEIIYPPLRGFRKLEGVLPILEKCLYVCFGVPLPHHTPMPGKRLGGLGRLWGKVA